MATLLASVACTSFAQDSVDVTFRYFRPSSPTTFLVGEFNGWSNSQWPMTFDGTAWIRTARLRVGGNPAPPAGKGIVGGWQYKFYYAGVSDWPNDPLNHHQNPADNNNTYIITGDPTIYQFTPNQRQPLVTTSTPLISVYLYPKVGATLDTSTISLTIDGTTLTGLGSSYDAGTKRFTYTPAIPLTNGSHTVIISAGSSAGSSAKDTVKFTTQAGFVKITTQGGYATWNPYRKIRGVVQDTSLTSVRIIHNGTDTSTVSLSGGLFAFTDTLTEGVNVFRAAADSAGGVSLSDPVTFTYLVDHAPKATISFVDGGGTIQLQSTVIPDTASTLTRTWSEDPGNPSALGGINGNTLVTLTIAKPAVPGEYYFGLIVRDGNGNADTTRNYFTLLADRTIATPTIASSPEWVKKGRIYFLFPKAASSAGTLNAAVPLLQQVKNLGFNIVWLMPIMKNAYPIDQWYGVGYNIVDFYSVAPEYGSNQDFKNFVDQAHVLGLKVILDITPNHTSRFHPWSQDAHVFREDSRYWSWYQHAIIPHNDNGLGQSLDADGFNYYSAFSNQLLNYNWSDPDARHQMIDVYKYWMREFGVDGYRFDVYWGPHRRYGEAFMGKPVRDALKHMKPDILLLAEDDGTGPGTETIYADYSSGGINGGVDAAYDFKLYFSQIRNFGFSADSINYLHAAIDNGGYYPGKNALYMRFMESQDEDRIAYFYSNSGSVDPVTTFMKTMPVASVVFTAPGIPMIWNGQEVGWGYGIAGAKENRTRSTINWNYQGKGLLTPHYQKLATIRAQFPAFTQHKRDTNNDGSVSSADTSDFLRISSTNGNMYAFARPFTNQNGMTVVNMTTGSQTTRLNLLAPGTLMFDGGIAPGSLYYLNNLYAGTSTQIAGADLDSVMVTLPGYGTGIYTLSTTIDSVKLLGPVLAVGEQQNLPEEFILRQNYPNPFNPSTTIRFSLPAGQRVSLIVYDVLGREVVRLIDGEYPAGEHSIVWNGRNSNGVPVGSGVYFSRLIGSGTDHGAVHVNVRKMMLMK